MKVPPHSHPFKRHRHVHQHRVKLPGGFNQVMTEPDEPLPGMDPIVFDDTMESGLWDDEELGVIPFIGPAIEAVGEVTGLTGAAKGLFQELGLIDKPKKKSEAPTVVQAPSAGIDPALLAALAGKQGPQYTGVTPTEVQYIVKDLLGSISPPVRQKVREVVQEMKGQNASEENLVANIEQRVGTNVMPILNKAIEALKLAQTQTDATSEHRSIVKEQDRWRESLNNQQQLMNRIALMEKRIAGAMNNKKRR